MENWVFGDGFPNEVANKLTKQAAEKTPDGEAIEYFVPASYGQPYPHCRLCLRDH